MTALSLTNLNVALGSRSVLRGISANFVAGECVAIMGPNGSGKSTLMRTAAGLIPAASGAVALHGKPLTTWRRADLARVAYPPQGGEVHWPLTVRNIGARPPAARTASRSGAAPTSRYRARDASVRRRASADRPATSLSGGERARALLARALSSEAKIILADEPFAQLDPSHQLHAMEVLKAASEAGALVIVVLHDLSIAARHATRVLLLSEGHVSADGEPAATLSSEALRKTFGIDAFIGDHAGAPVILPLKRRAEAAAE
jgi:iron complex transport system ATP-binding protein